MKIISSDISSTVINDALHASSLFLFSFCRCLLLIKVTKVLCFADLSHTAETKISGFNRADIDYLKIHAMRPWLPEQNLDQTMEGSADIDDFLHIRAKRDTSSHY